MTVIGLQVGRSNHDAQPPEPMRARIFESGIENTSLWTGSKNGGARYRTVWRESRGAPIYPGEVLLPDFLEPLTLSQYRLAHSISVQSRQISEIVHGKRADKALRLASFSGTSEQFWLNLQARQYLDIERDRLGVCGSAEVEVFAAAD